MHNQTKSTFRFLSVLARIIFVTILILPGSLSTGFARAQEQSALVPARATTMSDPIIENSTPQSLPFSQDWSNTGLITTSDNWSGVPGIMGYRGDNLTSSTGTDPRTLLMDDTGLVVDVNANRNDPDLFTTGGISEFELPDPVVAFQGSGTADAPYLLISISTRGFADINVAYNLRDIDGSADNAAQQVALHYRLGSSGSFTNLTSGYVADATTGPSLATLVTAVSVTLPADADNKALVQLRIMTTNAVGNDEWVGVDDLSITGTPASFEPEMLISKTAPAEVEINDTFTYTLSVENSLGMTADEVVITDSLPLSVTFLSASDGGGVITGTNVVSWTVPTLADGAAVVRSVSVTGPTTETTLINDDYGVWASNWVTFTVGSPVTTTVVTPEVITPIAEARAAVPGWTGTVQGNVTVVPNTFATRSFAIQDDTGGIYVYPASDVTRPEMNLGDVVQVKGTLKDYKGLLELDPVATITKISVGETPAPLVTPTGSVTPTQGKLVQIQGLVSSKSTSYGNTTVKINDGSGETTVYIYSLTAIDTTSIAPGVEMRVTGFSGAYNGPQVSPRYQSDLYIFPPEVTDNYPENGASNVNLYRPLTATFSHMMDAATIDTTSFTLTQSADPVSGAVTYDPDTKTATFTPTSHLAESTLYTATLTTAIKDIYDIALSSVYTWTFTSGLVDTTPPAIVGREPAPDAIDVPLDASVIITFTEDMDPSTLNQSAFLLEGPYGDVPYALTYDPIHFAVTLDPNFNLLPTSNYTVTVLGTVEDWAGHPLGAESVWTFETMVEPEMNVYLGDLHNHTGYSDGSGTPAEALAAGKAAGLDFMAISDHSYKIDDTQWADTLTAVNAATGADFLALRGFEYTQGAEGHINVYNTVRHAVRTDTGCSYCDYTPNLEAGTTVDGFYEWLADKGMDGIDAAGTVTQFNHPGWINFNDWTYHPEVSAVARLEEVGNGNGTSYDFSEDEFIRSLDYGWKVGATNNADTHTDDWGTNTDHRTGVLMAELTKDDLLEALRARRTYATEDKDFSLSMKANGFWMGSEIPNSGSVQFEIKGLDPDSELASMVQIITDQGKVAGEYHPSTASFTLTPQLNITTGVHYFYVKVTQADGDRIVSSPVWTQGSEDISITDLVIEPTIPTIFNPSLLTVRVTNRVAETRAVTVTLDVDEMPVGSPVTLTVPANGDAFANFSWQPLSTGEVDVTAQITGAPAGDNPDDNASTLHLTVTDELVPLILIDAGKDNLNAGGNEMKMFVDDLSAHSYNVLKNLDTLTASDLNPTVVKLLIITAPAINYSTDELNVIADYMAAGGNLWLIGMSDYEDPDVANRENAILAAIETEIGSPINVRINDDEIIDGDDNNNYVFGPRWSIFPSKDTTGIGVNVMAITSWSTNSLRGHDAGTPLTSSTEGIQIVIQGDLDEGYTSDSYHNPNHTSNTDADGQHDAYIYNPTWVYPNPTPADPIPLPMAASTDLPGTAGRILLYGDSNDAFNSYAYTAGDGLQNELFNLESVMWLLGEPLHKSTIAEARAQAVDDQPDTLDKLVWVEGEITAAYGEFFNVLYVQDETGGITVHAPAGDIDSTQYTRGTKVRVVGTVGIYNGDTEIEFFEAEMVQVIEPSTGEVLPLPLHTQAATLEGNQGWLTVITGTVTTKIGNDTIFVDDGSGPVRVFLDGYNGDFDDITLFDRVRVIGLVSEDGEGPRIRVRNHLMHPEYSDDVVPVTHVVYFTLVMKH